MFRKRWIFIQFLLSLALLLGLSGCSSLMYYPKKEKFFSPEKLNLPYEEVRYRNQLGLLTHGWWFPAQTKEVKGTWVYFHGNAENITSHFMALSWLPPAGYNFFIFDYPGYGESEGYPDPYVNVQSGISAIQWVHQNKDKRPLVIYGQSMGGIIGMRTAIEVKAQIPLRAVIADGTFSSFQRIARKKLATSWLTWVLQPLAYVVLSDKWAPEVSLISPVPLIVQHGEKDFVIEPEHGEKIYSEALDPKRWIAVPEAGHGNIFWTPDRKYRNILLQTLDEVAPN